RGHPQPLRHHGQPLRLLLRRPRRPGRSDLADRRPRRDAVATVGPPGLLPRYDGQSLLNVPASICAALGAAVEPLPPPLDAAILPPALLDGVRAVVLLVVDGLGRGQLDAAIAGGQAPTLAGLAVRATAGDAEVACATISSVFPSSTMPALSTL